MTDESIAERWRKKPVVIEAMHLQRGRDAGVIAEWCGGQVVKSANGRAIAFIVIPTLEGDMRADFGDWVIRGVKGEFYPCKPDIFDASYEAVDESAADAID